ncbi:APC family permease [Microbacterium sp. SD291]|uniref:APC family permease n=1 Tax=Microbacterium sp. SD291 TaxID=2782007 RepID=UPI001A974691|nr:APC family permease [Microbacterium sp. SD291]MBO0981824.1 APC family permease [Microbacterium sp. SD291]
MASTRTTESPAEQTTALKRNSLGVVGVAFFVIAAAAPMAAFVGAAPVVFSIVGSGAPAVYLVVAAIIAVFAVGYLKMSRHITNAGGFVAYIARGLGSRAATGSAGIVIITYLALQIGLVAQFGVFAQQLAASAGLDLPVWVWVMLAIAITTVLVIRGVDLNMRVLGVIIALEVIVVAVLIVGILIAFPGQDPSLESFSPAVLANPGVGVAGLFVFTCFTTFEATTVFAEEARNPRRTIPIALFVVIGFVAVYYTLATWAVSYGLGAGNVQQASADNLSGVIFDLASRAVGPWLSLVLQILVLTSFLAMLIGVQNMFARYCFALGRARVLPQIFARVSAVKRAPYVAALADAAACVIVLAIFFAAGADPIVVIYAWFVALGTIGFITMMTLASVAILAFFIRERLETGFWSTKFAPALALLLNGAVLVIALSNFDVLLFGDGTVAKAMLWLIPIAFAIGFVIPTFRKDIDFRVVAIA